MKGHTIEIIKELIVSLLIVICIAIILSMVLYDKVALGRVIPNAEDYTLTAEMQNELQKSSLDDAQEVIVDYYIDASDLKKYEKANMYVKGKSDPFAETSEFTNSTDNSSSSSGNSSSGNSGFYEDDGTK